MFKDEWKCTEAILNIFIEKRKDKKDRIKLSAFIREVFLDIQFDDPDDDISTHEVEVIRKLVGLIKNQFQLSHNGSMHPVLWMKWAMTLPDTPVLNNIGRRFGRWREGLPKNEVVVMQYFESGTFWTGRSWECAGFGLINGYLIDEIIFGNKVLFTPSGKRNIYSLKWQTYEYKKQFTDEEKRARICGSRLMVALEECIKMEIAAKRFKAISLQKTGTRSRYQSTYSREQLAELLKDRHKSILGSYGDETLKRALPQFVECPRGRKGGALI